MRGAAAFVSCCCLVVADGDALVLEPVADVFPLAWLAEGQPTPLYVAWMIFEACSASP